MADLVLRGEVFKGKAYLNPVRLSRLLSQANMGKTDAERQRSAASASYEWMQFLLTQSELERLEIFLEEQHVPPEEFGEAISNLMRGLSGRPLEQPNSSGDGSNPIGPISRVVSFKPDTGQLPVSVPMVVPEMEPETETQTSQEFARQLLAGRSQAS